MADSTKQSSAFRSMNPWVLHLQKLGLELKCPLCLNLLKRPILLPCDHIFCNSCLPERTQFGSECLVCKAQYVDRDLRPMSFIENILTIYRSLDAAFCANLLQSSSSDFGKSLEKCPTSTGEDFFDKSSKESFKDARKDNSTGTRCMFSLSGKRLDHILLNCSTENGVHKNDMANKCSLQRDFKNYVYEIAGSGGNEVHIEQNINSLQVSSQLRAEGIQESGSMQIGTHRVYQLSAGSPPSFGDIKSSENDSCDQGGDDSPKNYQALTSVKQTLNDRTRQERHDSSTSETEGVNSRDSKRHKNLNYGPLSIFTNSVGHIPISSETEKLGICHTQPVHISIAPCSAEPPALLHGSSIEETVCGFCQSYKISKDTGPMLHFVNGKLVEGDEASSSNAIHVHRICMEWAPQVYFVDDGSIKNLKEELTRGAKLKCSRCGLKGAALGCYQKSCRRSYHVMCAQEIAGCRWDCGNFLVLCPSHTSVRFPNEQKSKSKKPQKHSNMPSQDCHGPAQIAPHLSNFWAESFNGAKEWVFCGSALSSEEKCLLVEFGSMIGVPVTKFWKANVTHVVAATDAKGASTRTMKVLMAILNGRWVLTIDWVKACMKSMRPVDEEAYEVSLDNHGCHNGPRTGRLSVLNNAPKLFNGFNFYFAGDFVLGYKEDLQNLVIAAGGNILKSKDELAQQSQDDLAASSTSLVVYNVDPPQGCKLGEEVTILWQRLNEAEELAVQTGSHIIGHTWVLESIASYKLQPFVNLDSISDAKNLLV